MRITTGIRKWLITIAERTSTIPYSTFYRIYFNFFFCLFISPFRVCKVRHEGTTKVMVNGLPVFRVNPKPLPNVDVRLEGYWIQKVICGIIHALVAAVGFLEAWSYLTTSNFKQDPSRIFGVLLCEVTFLSILLFIYLVWFREGDIRDVVVADVKGYPAHSDSGNPWRKLFQVVLIITITVGQIVAAIIESRSRLFDPVTSSAETFFMTVPSNYTSFMELDLEFQCAAVTYSIVLAWTHGTWRACSTLVLISSLSGYEAVVETQNVITEHHDKKLSEKISELLKLKGKLGRLNKLCGFLLVTYFTQSLSHAMFLIGAMFSDIPNTLVAPSLFLLFADVISFVIAAETQYKVESLVNAIIFEGDGLSNSGLNVGWTGAEIRATVAHAPGQLGLRAHKFFTFTYSFLGTSQSIVLTYGLVLIQFITAKTSPTTNNG